MSFSYHFAVVTIHLVHGFSRSTLIFLLAARATLRCHDSHKTDTLARFKTFENSRCLQDQSNERVLLRLRNSPA